MRKSPDGTREVIEMLVPIIGSRSRTFRVTGLGLSPKILIGAEDLPVATCLDITNRDVSGHLRYDMIETVRGGMMPLDDRPLQKGDQTYAARSGATFGLGTRSSPQEGNGEAVVVEGAENSNPTMAWLVTDERGKYLLVAPAALDSFELASKIARAMHGEFMIEMLTSGSLTACDEPAAPGWRVMLEPILNTDEAAPHFN